MDIKSHLILENSRKNWNEVIAYIGFDKMRFAELMDLFFNAENKIIQRASQPVGIIAEKRPTLIRPYLSQLVEYLNETSIAGVKRNIMRMFQFIEIPEEVEGPLFDIGMLFLKSLEEPIAVKAFSMTVLRKICEKYPELSIELIHQIEILVREKVSTGVVNRGKHELKKLNDILSKHKQSPL